MIKICTFLKILVAAKCIEIAMHKGVDKGDKVHQSFTEVYDQTNSVLKIIIGLILRRFNIRNLSCNHIIEFRINRNLRGYLSANILNARLTPHKCPRGANLACKILANSYVYFSKFYYIDIS